MKTIFVDPGCCANAVPWQWHKLARHTVLGHSQGLRVGLQVFGPKVLARGRGAKRSHRGLFGLVEVTLDSHVQPKKAIPGMVG